MTDRKKFQEMTIVGIASDNRNMQPVVILKENKADNIGTGGRMLSKVMAEHSE